MKNIKYKYYLSIITNYLRSQAKKINRYTKVEKTSDENAFSRTYFGEETWIAAASYIPFISAVVLILRKGNSEFVSFHSRQALVLVLLIVLGLLLLPPIYKVILAITAYLVLIYGAYQSLKGKKWYFPLVTELANTIDL